MKALLPISAVYGALVAARNRRFDRGSRVEQVGVPVISIGNVTTGGTGKTPCVQWVVRTLQEAGHRPAVALRGYGSGRSGVSDEAAEHSRLLPGVPVLAHPDRVAAVRQHLGAHRDCDVVVLDDGFQHRFIARQADIVLVDARRAMSAQRLLPAGRMREPWSSLRRASAVVVTHAESVDAAMASEIESAGGEPPMAWCRHVWKSLERHDSQGVTEVPVANLEGCAVVTRFGVASAAGVRAQAQAAGARIVADLPARDHRAVSAAELLRMEQASMEADAVLVTGKDWASLGPLVDWSRLKVPVLIPRLEIDFLAGGSELGRHVRAAASESV
ncbi:MAG: tetraacyldisaccharide 4'-kinase [Phycisphaerales bacterium]|jgi:tetraacyldisaccharide 4'-kinase|nr:tetraacyldisaccharide 4'-kinase [Phycisphaerales bacterium]